MGKSKTKDRITDEALLKAMTELEEVAAESLGKADPLQGRDPEGGLSTEGKPLSDKAPKGKGEAVKADRQSSSSGSSDSASAPPKKMKKARAASSASSASSDSTSDHGAHDGPGDESSAGPSCAP